MNLIKRFFLLFTFFYFIGENTIFASECENRLFTLNIESTSSHTIRLKDVLSDLSSSCHITILYADKLTKEKLNKKLDMLYINDLNLNELFELLLHEHNLFYTYDETLSRLKLSYVKTKSFNIDYVNITQMNTLSTRDITVGATALGNAGGTTGGANGTSTGGASGSTSGGSAGGANGSMNSDSTTVTASSDFTFWDELKGQIDGMLQRDGDSNEVKSWSMINRDAGLITVSGSYNQLSRIEKYINDLEKRMHKQVLLEVRILEVTYSDGENVGIDWSKFELSLSGEAGSTATKNVIVNPSNFYTAGFNFSMDGLFNFLNTYGNVEVLSSPKVMTLNNQPALINVGDQLNYKYENGQVDTAGLTTPTATTTFTMGSVFIGLSLSIIPEITEDGHVILRINPVDSRIINENDTALDATSTSNTVRSIAPDVKLKQMTSIVKVKDGSKVLIGGLTQSESFNNDNKVPILGDIPYLGRLFHSTSISKSKKEFFIVVTPMIIKENRMPTIEEQEIIERTEKQLLFSSTSTKEEG